MRKSKKILTAFVATLALTCVAAFAGCNPGDDPSVFKNTIESMGNLFENSLDRSLPQTIVHDLVMDHFDLEKNPLPEGKTKKKAIFLGYDGFRADALVHIKDQNESESSILTIKNEGGLYLTYSGGDEVPQPTSTAPSWASMLTGGWKAYTGVDDNGYVKDKNAKTFLTKLAETGKYKASFTTSWREHQSGTYRNDIIYAIQNDINVTYTHCVDDADTLYTVLSQVADPKGTNESGQYDALFFTLEQGDHAGHSTSFGNHNPDYVAGTTEADNWGKIILDTIKARAAYESEDWLIVISTDHGGLGKSHGGQSIMERTTWLACNKTAYLQKRLAQL